MPKTENRGGSRVANPDYKKVRRDVFSMVEKLVDSNTILTQSLQHNEKLQTKCLVRIKDMRVRIDDLVAEIESLHHDWEKSDQDCDQKQLKINELENKIEHQDELIIGLNNDICDAAEKSSPDFPRTERGKDN